MGLDFREVRSVHSTMGAFLALTAAGGFCWGSAEFGGDCRDVNLTGVTRVFSTGYAFIAVKDGPTGTSMTCSRAALHLMLVGSVGPLPNKQERTHMLLLFAIRL